jgi:hypothetical protein
MTQATHIETTTRLTRTGLVLTFASMNPFKDMKAMIDGAQQMQADAMAMMQQANQPIDPDDPAFAPIEGVTIDRYAEVTAALARQNLAGLDQIEAWLETQGVARGTWESVQHGWVQRMAANVQVRNRYGVLYSQYA